MWIKTRLERFHLEKEKEGIGSERKGRWGEQCARLVSLMMFTGETVDGRGPIVGACRGRVTVTLMSLTVTAHKQYLGVSPRAIAEEEVCSSIYRRTTAIESFPDLSTSVAEILIHHQRKNLLLLLRLTFILFLWCFFGGFKVSSSWYDQVRSWKRKLCESLFMQQGPSNTDGSLQ